MMTLAIPDDILRATRMSDKELMQEISVMLFQKEKLAQASPPASCYHNQKNVQARTPVLQ